MARCNDLLGKDCRGSVFYRLGNVVVAIWFRTGECDENIAGLDAEKKLTVPNPSDPNGPTYALPTPRFAFLIQVKDATLYNMIAKKLKAQQDPPVQEVAVGPLKKLFIQIDPDPEYPMSPVVSFDGSPVIFASHAPYLKQLLNANGSGADLAKS